LNCVALVTNSTKERLEDKAKMSIEKMLNLFHKQVKDNILPVCTFADSGTPLCLAGLRKDQVPFTKYIKVQNSAFAGRLALKGNTDICVQKLIVKFCPDAKSPSLQAAKATCVNIY